MSRATGATPRKYQQRRPEATILYRIIQEHLESFLAHAHESSGRHLPKYVENEFRRYLECGVHAHGFARAVCETCGDELLLPFSCKLRGICPCCSTRRMSNTAAHLIDLTAQRSALETIGEGPTSRRPVSVSIFICRCLHLRVRADVFCFADGFRQCACFVPRRRAARSASWTPPTQVDLSPITPAAEVEDLPALVRNALNLTQIVHSRPSAVQRVLTGQRCVERRVRALEPLPAARAERHGAGYTLHLGDAERLAI